MDIMTYCDFQVNYFKEGASSGDFVGVELEHFLVDCETLRSYSYFESNGQKDIINRLLKSNNGWKLLSAENGYPLGIAKNGSTITFEPGGQIEISLKPFQEILEIKKEYDTIIDEIYGVLESNQRLVSIGYHPKTKIEQLPILPKKRYEMMYNYFKNNGSKSHNMMKGTAATQVSIDYIDEQDFIKKYRVAHFLAPVLSSLFDSTPIIEGQVYAKNNARIDIWNNTDPARSKLVSGVLSREVNFKSYAEYLLGVAPIFIVKNGLEIYTGEKTLYDLLDIYNFTEEELEHILSMVFPDVRLKKFIEIRMIDALPYPYGLSAVVMIKAIFYTPSLLDKLYQKSKSFDDKWIIKQNRYLVEDHSQLDHSFIDLKESIIDEVLAVVSGNERSYVTQFKNIISEHGSIANWLKNIYSIDRDLFARIIEIPCTKKGVR